MIYRLPSIVFRSLLSVLLLAALGGCSLYRKVHHPYRLPTPKPSPEYIAQQKEKKAAEKLRASKDKAAASASKKKKPGDDAPEEAATDVSVPTENGASADASAIKSSVYPERSTVRYDKHEMMKKPKLTRRQRHKYGHPFRPIQSIRDFFKYGFHAKPNYSIDHRAVPKAPSEDALPDEPIPTPAEPDVEPAEATPKRDKKAPKQKAPKPDKSPRQEVVPTPDSKP